MPPWNGPEAAHTLRAGRFSWSDLARRVRRRLWWLLVGTRERGVTWRIVWAANASKVRVRGQGECLNKEYDTSGLLRARWLLMNEVTKKPRDVAPFVALAASLCGHGQLPIGAV